MKQLCKTFRFGIVLFLACVFEARADNVYVSDSGGGTIMVFNSTGNGFVFASGLDAPAGLAFDSTGDLYVANTGSGTIEKYDSSGNNSIFASGLNNPAGLAFDNGGSLYVANLGNGAMGSGTIKKFDLSGNGSVFASGLSFSGSAYLVLNSSGSLYASTLRAIEKFTPDGNESVISSTLNYVYGLAVDRTGNLFASYQNAGSIRGINGGGIAFQNPFAASPSGLEFDSNNNLFVALGGTVEEFDSFGGTTQTVQEASGFIFASGLSGAHYIAIQPVPEVSTWALMMVGAGVWHVGCQRRRRSSQRLS
jgi:sugar lactone lactonase YvrE